MSIDITKLDEAQLVELNGRIVARLNYLQEARTHRQMLLSVRAEVELSHRAA